MHRLHLLRHAKSSRDDGVEDQERRLSRRGRDDARAVGEMLPNALGALDLVLCSSARRTRETEKAHESQRVDIGSEREDPHQQQGLQRTPSL